MANHKSAIKRIRANEKKRLHNKYHHKTTRNAIRDLEAITDKKEAQEKLPKVISMIDKLTKTNIIHKNKAGNIKSRLTKNVSAL